jgi:1-acyl-sn-glycerol-3-phosphate acyltransferase
LGKGIPSVSYNLRHGGSVLINRRDPKSAITEIKKLGEYIQEHNRSAVIFPEGTRSKDGRPKPFAQSGIKILCKYAPSAYLVPITINNSWKLVKFGMFPVGLGKRLEFIIHEAIPVNGKEIENILEKTENAVVKSIKIG